MMAVVVQRAAGAIHLSYFGTSLRHSVFFLSQTLESRPPVAGVSELLIVIGGLVNARPLGTLRTNNRRAADFQRLDSFYPHTPHPLLT